MLEIALSKDGHKVETVSSGDAAKKKLDSALFDVVVTDIKMPRTTGIDVLRHAHTVSPETAVVLITAVDDLDFAIQAVKAGGASDYLRKGPALVEDVKIVVAQAIENVSLKRKIFAHQRDAASRNSLDHIIGTSNAVKLLKETIQAVAPAQSTILIKGESGTGKELVARGIHSCSPRSAQPFVTVNCGAFPETLLESELFGYVKGAFTGANQNRSGLFEAANGGTVFLDEIGETTLAMQVKLLRVLQERVVRPVGGTIETAVDVRVITATNRDIESMVVTGSFREDLYYRLSVIPIEVPSLRERGDDDIKQLSNHFMKKYSAGAGKSFFRIGEESQKALCEYSWPGNVRQLENTIERAVALCNDEELRVDLPSGKVMQRLAVAAAAGGSSIGVIPSEGLDMERYVADLERSLLQSALRQSNGVQTKAAEILKLSYRSFRHLIKKYDL
jgi:two-component system response regulator PilR (NtrC family)